MARINILFLILFICCIIDRYCIIDEMQAAIDSMDSQYSLQISSNRPNIELSNWQRVMLTLKNYYLTIHTISPNGINMDKAGRPTSISYGLLPNLIVDNDKEFVIAGRFGNESKLQRELRSQTVAM